MNELMQQDSGVAARRDLGVRRIDVDAALLLVRSGAVFIDVLPEAIYVQEHLPGAVNLPLENLGQDAVEEMDRTRPVVVYCFDQH